MITTITVLLFSLFAADRSSIKPDEAVIFFPTYGYSVPGDPAVHALVHGWIYQPEEKSAKREAALNLFRKSLGLPETGTSTATFKIRAGLFLVDNIEKKTVSIRLGKTIYPAGTSGENGHFQAGLNLSGNLVKKLSAGQSPPSLEYQAVTPTGDGRKFTGKIFLIGPTGLSVVSDIDDTIKVTGAYNPNAVIANSFLKPFQAVPGMAQAYRQWEKAGAVFHYVSAGPWQMYPPLLEFLRSDGFPQGTFHLRNFRWSPLSILDFISPPEGMKLKAIEPIMKDFPNRTFIFVGDTAQRDPEVYGQLARNHPGQVQKIYIRNITRETLNSDRLKKAFDQLPKDQWILFTDPRELQK